MNQNQKTDNQSVSNQAKGDIHQQINYHNGLQEKEVKELCYMLYEQNHKKLVLAAQEKAKEEVSAYAVILFDELSKLVDEEINNKLKEPEIQAAINDTVKIVARKGSRADKGILSELIKEKIEKFEIEEESSVIDDAISIMPSITSSQMMFCAILYMTRQTEKLLFGKPFSFYEEDGYNIPGLSISSTIPEDERKRAIQQMFREMLLSDIKEGSYKLLFPIEKISAVNKNLMSLRRLLSEGKHYTTKTEDILKKKLFLKEGESIDSEIPELMGMLSKFGISSMSELDNCVLTTIGECIGLNYVRSKVKIKIKNLQE